MESENVEEWFLFSEQDSWSLYIIPQQADSLHSIFSEETEMLMAIAWLCFAANQVTSAAPMSFRSPTWPLVDYRNFNSSGQCGVDGRVGDLPAIGNRSKRYVLQGNRWMKRQLTYKISKYSTYLKADEVDSEIARAFRVWETVTDFTFVRSDSDEVEIEISFQRGYHGDAQPFEGYGGVLAHASFPNEGGYVHFDDQEPWTVNSSFGYSLFQVAVHEFGHTLGLRHSEDRFAIMFPHYPGYLTDFQLNGDDIKGIHALYGIPNKFLRGFPTTTTTTTSRTPLHTSNVSEDLCVNGTFDTIFSAYDGNTYVFKGSQFWKLNGIAVASGYPRPIQIYWPGLPDDIDAAFSDSWGRAFFFKGSKYWRFTNYRPDPGYPQLISDGFPGIPADLDAAFVWRDYGRIYFFKGGSYWRLDPDRESHIDLSTYPRLIVKNWPSTPSPVSAAFQHTNGHVYFFQDDLYWRKLNGSQEGTPYPRKVRDWWFGCKLSQ